MDERRQHLFDELAVVGKAFGSARRLEIVDLLARGERTVDGLARAAGMGVSTVSAHLQVLKSSNLVRTRREGTRIHYRLAGSDVLDLYAAMRDVARERSADVSRAPDAYLNLPGSEEIGEVTREEVREGLRTGEITLLDVRPEEEEYDAGHIPGAVSAPLSTPAERADALRQAPCVVTYCRGSFCVMAHDAVRVLGASGVEARRLEDGMLEWRRAGLEVAS
ncbi:metalloregulator ArsR/SmtB family transcription factor [Janibacter limosus]|uniref:Metalloregulator ArsR/SmtB family transcription factor n=1 Tax=Janibacter limosus TaxID=53458 RepID=A0AC61U2Q2_9MICO|nr:metalloregulator ArsR/SmtB family transcription factor [Janibacter limosus]UUZ44326.1 metalloregulator ArsR/SmtB family transcription factor [Janibacter limosus]